MEQPTILLGGIFGESLEWIAVSRWHAFITFTAAAGLIYLTLRHWPVQDFRGYFKVQKDADPDSVYFAIRNALLGETQDCDSGAVAISHFAKLIEEAASEKDKRRLEKDRDRAIRRWRRQKARMKRMIDIAMSAHPEITTILANQIIGKKLVREVEKLED